MKFLKQHKKSLLTLFGLISTIALIVFLPIFFSDKAFVIASDSRHQYVAFFEELRTMFREVLTLKRLPFYSWNYLFGNNFWASKLFYYHDFFDYFFVIFRSSLHYYDIAFIQTIVKIYIAAFCFFYYSVHRNYSARSCIIGSVLFAYSGWALLAVANPFFLTFYIFIPLYFYTIDVYLKQGKCTGYILISAFLLFLNYYFFFSLSLFSVFYFLYDYYQQKETLKGFMKKALPLIGGYLLAVLITGIVTLPSFYHIITNDRVLKFHIGLSFPSIKYYFSFLSGLFYPTATTGYGLTNLTSIYRFNVSNFDTIALWSTSLTALLLPQIFCDRKKRRLNLIAYGILVMFLFFPLGSSIMQGFSEPGFRWLYLIVFFNITMILSCLDQIQNINRKVLLISIITITFLQLVNIPLLSFIEKLNFQTYFNEYLIMLSFLVLIWICWFILRSKKHQSLFLLIFVVIECSLAGFLSLNLNLRFSDYTRDFVQAVEANLGSPEQLKNWLLELDDQNRNQFYRTYVDYDSLYWQYSENMNLHYQFMGVKGYDSTFSPSISDLFLLKENPNEIRWMISVIDPELIDFFNVKYAVVTEESQLPHLDFVLVGDYFGVPVYENLHYYNLIQAYDQVITYYQYSESADLSRINTSVIVHDMDYDTVCDLVNSTEIEVDYVIKGKNTLEARVVSSQTSFITLAIPYDLGWEIHVNGKEVEKYQVNGGVIGFAVPEGASQINLYFVPRGLMWGAIFSICGGMGLIVVFLLERKRRKKNECL